MVRLAFRFPLYFYCISTWEQYRYRQFRMPKMTTKTKSSAALEAAFPEKKRRREGGITTKRNDTSKAAFPEKKRRREGGIPKKETPPWWRHSRKRNAASEAALLKKRCLGHSPWHTQSFTPLIQCLCWGDLGSPWLILRPRQRHHGPPLGLRHARHEGIQDQSPADRPCPPCHRRRCPDCPPPTGTRQARRLPLLLLDQGESTHG